MNDRLDKLLIAEQLTPARFADIIGVQRSSISHIISGRNKPSFDFIAKVLQKFPRLNSEWLILGKGEMYKHMVQGSLFGAPVPLHSESSVEPIISSQEPVEEVVDDEYEQSSQLSSREPEIKVQPSSIADIAPLLGKEVERIVVFYRDRTFVSYTPSEDK